MGGGDLNLKKSWHPSTLRNIERVWKAEQKHEAEQQKIEQLQKELAEERSREEIRAFAQDQGIVKKKDERLEWMYQGPTAMVNREEYLMGRKVDKTFEILKEQENGQEEQKDFDSKPGAIFSQSSANATVDIANKIREDPLFNIMKREKEERKSLLTNPVKMKQLQQLLQKSISKDVKKKKDKKKQKKTWNNSDTSDRSSSEIDHNRNWKKDQAKQKKHHSHVAGHYKSSSVSHHKDSSDMDSSDVDNNRNQKRQDYQNKKFHSCNIHDQASARDAGSQKYQQFDDKRQYEVRLDEKYCRSKYKHHSEDSYQSSKSSNHCQSKKSSDLKNKNEHFMKPYEYHKGNSHTSRNGGKDEKRKLSEEEKEHMRQVMMMNAKLRDQQRQKNVKRYKEEDERENNVNKYKAPDFIRPMLSKAAEKGSVEKRVKQKIFTIQRNHSEMARNFAKR